MSCSAVIKFLVTNLFKRFAATLDDAISDLYSRHPAGEGGPCVPISDIGNVL